MDAIDLFLEAESQVNEVRERKDVPGLIIMTETDYRKVSEYIVRVRATPKAGAYPRLLGLPVVFRDELLPETILVLSIDELTKGINHYESK